MTKPTIWQRLTRYRKAEVAAIGAAASWAVQTFPDDTAVQHYGGLVLALLTALGVYLAPNTPPAGQPADPKMSEQDPAPQPPKP